MARPKGSGLIKLTPAVIDMALKRLANGEILTAICRDIGVSHSAFAMKAVNDQAFADRYARARQMQAHALAADVVRIADEEPDPQIARVRCDARKWLAARIDPKNYGDKQTIEHKRQVDVAEMPFDELLAIAQGRRLIEHQATDAEVIPDTSDDDEKSGS